MQSQSSEGKVAQAQPTADRLKGLIDPSLFRAPRRSYSNPTIWLFAIDLGIFSASTAAYLAGAIGHFAAAGIAIACLYCFYTVTHDAVHYTAHANPSINNWMGRVAAALQGLTFPLFRIIHLQHHAYTNDPARDPDFVIGRQPRWLLPVWTIVRLLHDNQFMMRRGLWKTKPRQLREHLITVAIQGALVSAGAVAGGLEFVLWAWIVPVIVAGAALELTVAWAVHYPHVSQHPLEHTRMLQGRVWQILMLNQNYHLVHHLWPRIPWFRYPHAVAAANSAVGEHLKQGSEIPH